MIGAALSLLDLLSVPLIFNDAGAVLEVLFTPINLLLMFAGVGLGMVFGSVPGFTGSNTVAVFLPLTIPLTPEIALVFMSCLYVGAMYGGAIPAVLINTPGTTAATATVLDAYPMSQQGKPSLALGISIMASVIGGLLSAFIILLILQPLGDIAFLFANREIFVLGLFGLAAVASALGEDTRKGLISGLFGLFLASWAGDPTTGQPRLDFGYYPLYDEVPFIPVVIGLFAISELFYLIRREQISEDRDIATNYGEILDGFRYVISKPAATLRAMIIGLGIGSLPGAGASVANFVSWATAKSISSTPEKFGEGNPDGVIASEASNNAVTSGSLVPTLVLGIPGSGSTAVMLAALLLHGLRPGPQLMQNFGFEANVIITSLLFANIFLLFIAFFASKYVVQVVVLPTEYLVPSILVLTAIGAYVIRNNVFDIWFMFLFGIIGIIMRENGYSLVPLILGIILGPIVEGAFLRGWDIGGQSWLYFFDSTIAILLWIAIVLILTGRKLYDGVRPYVRSALQ